MQMWPVIAAWYLMETRNRAYADALETLIKPDSVVLDLGAGLGIHGLMAAARAQDMFTLLTPAQSLPLRAKWRAAMRLGFQSDIQKPIEQADLPEQVDLIISVLTGNFLLEEDLLPSLFLRSGSVPQTRGCVAAGLR